MPALALVGVDSAGGSILGGGQNWVRIDGAAVAVVGDSVAPHGRGRHGRAVMAAGSPWVRIDGAAACRAGDAATCGHRATGSAWVNSS